MPSVAEYASDPYGALGLKPIINATCHHTRVGGTIMPPEVLEAMRAAADHHVEMPQLLEAAGDVIARLTHAEAGYVVSGCAAALLVGTAAILTGKDPAKMMQLPDLAGMYSEVIAERFPRRPTDDGNEYIHYGYAFALKTTGVSFVEVGDGHVTTADELEAAFTPETAMVYWGTGELDGNLQVEEVVEIADRHDIPVLVDNSNNLPPKRHLHRYIDAGAALVAFSGGKGIRGPQGSGILAGRRDLIEAVAMQSAPTQGIGRVAKVSKEEIVGLVTALELFAEQDEEELLTEQRRRAQMLADMVHGYPGTNADVMFPDHAGRIYPTVMLSVGDGRTAEDVIEELRTGDPAVAAMNYADDPKVVRFDVRLCEEWEIEAIADRLKAILAV